MTIDPDSYRSVLGRFASGVTVITARDVDERDVGMTVSAFCSVSLQPPLVQACVDRNASVYMPLERADRFCVNVLSATQEALSRRFATVESTHRFEGLGYTRRESGIVLLEDALAHLECRIVDRHAAGDHTLIIGEVEWAECDDKARPLLYYRGGYAQLER